MTEKNQIYKCNVCGNVVEILHPAGGELVCCGKPMELLVEKTADEGMEKHVPIVVVEGNKVSVKVGSVPHPMTEEHYIELIEILGDGIVIASCYLKPGEEPQAEFNLSSHEGVTARAYCNLHGLWKSK